MSVREEAALFGTPGRLVGIVTDPERASGDRPAFVLLNAGMTHRVGPNRLYVRLARELAAQGFVALRYDASTLGDSRLAAAAPDELETEPRQAMDWLAATRGVRRFVLLGLCSGAVASLRAAGDESVAGVVLIGLPPPRGRQGARVLLRHYGRLLFKSSFRARKWRALGALRFDVQRALGSFAGLLTGGAPPAGPDLASSLAALRARGVELLVVHAEGDEGLDHTRAVVEPPLRVEVIPGANHLFTLLSSQEALVRTVLLWAARLGTGA